MVCDKVRAARSRRQRELLLEPRHGWCWWLRLCGDGRRRGGVEETREIQWQGYDGLEDWREESENEDSEK